MFKIFDRIVEIIAWLQIVVSPLIISSLISAFIYFRNPNPINLVISIAIIIIGLIIGILWANKIWKTKGTSWYMSQVSATPDLDEINNEGKKENIIYKIFLEQKLIGTTELENADAPMGVAFGKINFIKIKSGFEFFKQYCENNKIEFEAHLDDKLISTRYIPNLKVVDENNAEIIGNGNYIVGMDGNDYEINIEGISYPYYEEKFPEHVKRYNEMFN